MRGDAYVQRADFDAWAYSPSLLAPHALNANARIYILALSCLMMAPKAWSFCPLVSTHALGCISWRHHAPWLLQRALCWLLDGIGEIPIDNAQGEKHCHVANQMGCQSDKLRCPHSVFLMPVLSQVTDVLVLRAFASPWVFQHIAYRGKNVGVCKMLFRYLNSVVSRVIS